MKRYVIEFGMGLDFHGQDVNNAAIKAVKDAISKSCLCGLDEILGIKDLSKIHITATVAVTKPEHIDKERIASCLPVGQVTVKATHGGMRANGLCLELFGDKDDSIEAAVACVEVFVDICQKNS